MANFRKLSRKQWGLLARVIYNQSNGWPDNPQNTSRRYSDGKELERVATIRALRSLVRRGLLIAEKQSWGDIWYSLAVDPHTILLAAEDAPGAQELFPSIQEDIERLKDREVQRKRRLARRKPLGLLREEEEEAKPLPRQIDAIAATLEMCAQETRDDGISRETLDAFAAMLAVVKPAARPCCVGPAQSRWRVRADHRGG